MKIGLIVSLCILFGTFFLVLKIDRAEFAHTTDFLEHEQSVSSSKELVETDERIRFVGDIMLGRNVERLMETHGFWYPFSKLPPNPSSTVLVGNFEGTVPKMHVPTPSMHFTFSFDRAYLQGLKKYGFTQLSLANNHSYDFGADDFAHTKEVLKESGFAPFGDQIYQGSSTVAYITLAEERVAVFGVYAVERAPSREAIQRLIETASKESDMQIAFVHWGTEYEPLHSAFQEDLAKILIDAGAEVVIGHHPHVVQDIALYKGKPIFYSLGNFIFDQYFSEAVQDGLMVDFAPEGGAYHFTLLPVTSRYSRSQPMLMLGDERKDFLVELAAKSEPELQEMIVEGNITLKTR